MKKLKVKEIKYMVELHLKWLTWEEEGIRADFSYIDLEGVDFRWANLIYSNFEGSTLTNANFSGSNLRNASLSGANLDEAKTDKKYIQTSCIGSQKRMTTYCFEDDIIWCGCFKGNLQEFETQVRQTHVNNPQYLKEYLGFINYVKSLK
jgi:hypothetical protein